MEEMTPAHALHATRYKTAVRTYGMYAHLDQPARSGRPFFAGRCCRFAPPRRQFACMQPRTRSADLSETRWPARTALGSAFVSADGLPENRDGASASSASTRVEGTPRLVSSLTTTTACIACPNRPPRENDVPMPARGRRIAPPVPQIPPRAAPTSPAATPKRLPGTPKSAQDTQTSLQVTEISPNDTRNSVHGAPNSVQDARNWVEDTEK
jgi:hypothetical protein